MMLTIYLVRHGSTEQNKMGITMGHSDSPLTSDGLKEVKHLIERLKDIDFDYIYSSDLGRAYSTASIIAETLNKENKLKSTELLREIDYGTYVNRKKEEIKKECPEYKTDVSFVFPQGESYQMVYDRAAKFIKRLIKKHKNQNILVVTHAGVIRAMYCYLQDLEFQSNLNRKVSHDYIGKFEITIRKPVFYEEIGG